jgi:PhnB protein
MLRSTPFLLFDGNCAAAMTFYHLCLGGELTITPQSDTPMKDFFHEDKHGRIINAHLKSGAVEDRFQELHNMPFGTYGQFYDKFGVQWIFKGDKKE